MVFRRHGWITAPAVALALLGSSCRDPRPAPIVLLVTVDTLRADHLGSYGGPAGLTPHLDRLADGASVFTAAYAPAPFTLPSLAALLTSRYPEEVGIDGNSAVLARTAPTLPGWLKTKGWRTAAVVSNYVLRPSAGFDRGFDHYDATFPQYEAVRPVPERVAPDTTSAALAALDALLREGGGPAFLWVHYQDPHGPYAPSTPLRERFLEGERTRPDAARVLPVSATQSGEGAIPRYQFIDGHGDPPFYRAGYKGEVALVDAEVGRLWAGVEERGLLGRTHLVFASDHGEGMGEDDYWFAHGEKLTDPLVRVPLFLRGPGIPAARRDEVASLLDVFPTLAVLTGARPPEGLRGRDLLASGAAARPSSVHLTTLNVAAVPLRGIVARGYKYVVSLEEPRLEQLFRLGAETRDVAGGEPEALSALRRELAAAASALRVTGAERQALSAEEVEKLRSLGYVEGR